MKICDAEGVRYLLACVLLVGCGASTSTGGMCDRDTPCSGDEVCDFTSPDGVPVCVDPDGDDDGDGLPNKRDFCQHVAGGKYDEDLDGIGDDCDRCPIAPPPAVADTDTDAVDSPCDPDPDIDGDQIVVFSGFNDVPPDTWKRSAGWTTVGGEIVATPGATATATLTAPLPLVSTHVAILARYRIDALEAGATESAASVTGIDRRPAGVTTVTCGASRIGSTDRVLLDTTTATAQKNFMSSLFDTAGLYRVAAQLDGATAACALIGDTETGAVQANGPGEAMTEAGLSARGATVRFSYLLVVQRP